MSIPSSLVCPNCQLDLNHPDAVQLREASLNAVSALDARLELIGKIRFETAAAHSQAATDLVAARQAVADAAAAAAQERERERSAQVAASASENFMVTEPAPQAPLAAEPTSPAPLFPATVPLASVASERAEAEPVVRDYASGLPAIAATRSHYGVQVILLIVGVSLLSVGAIFFLIYAFISFGLIWRSVIIATITIASIVGATYVKKRGLTATAEALSSLAVVLILLDIYAVRANELLVLGDSAGRMYWGGALMASALGFMMWHRVTGLRLVNIFGYLAFPPAVALLVAGIASNYDSEVSTLAAMAALAAASLIHVTAAHDSYRAILERIVTVVYALLAIIVGFTNALWNQLAFSDSEVGGWLLAIGLIGAVHSVVAHRAHLPAFLRNTFATAAGILVASALWILISDAVISDAVTVSIDGRPASWLVLAVVAMLAVFALLAESSGRNLGSASRSATLWGSIGAWSVAAVATISPFATSLVTALEFVDQQRFRLLTPGNLPFEVTNNGWAQLALLSIPLAMSLAWLATGQLRNRIHLVLASSGVALALGAPLAGSIIGAVVTWLAIAAITLTVIAVDRYRRGARRTHYTVAAAGLLALVLAYSSSWSSYETWLFTSIVTAILLFIGRHLVDVAAVRVAILGFSAFVFVLAAAGIGEQLQFDLGGSQLNPLESWLTVSIVAALLFARSLWSRPRDVDDHERRLLWWMGFSITVIAGTILWIAAVSGAPFSSAPLALPLHLISLIVAIVVVAALCLTMLGRDATVHTAQRIAAAIVLAPATVWALDSASRTLGLNVIAIELAPATASVLIGILSMTLRVREHHPRVRLVSELSALTVAGVTTASAILQPQASHWLIALLVAITILLASISADGIFGSRSLRRHAIWLAVAFASWALWLRLDQSRVDALEAYVLPIAAVVLAISVFIARAELRESSLRSAPYISLVGLLIAIVPLSLNAASGTELRTLVMAGLCGALLLAAAFVTPRPRLVDFWGVATIAAASGLVLATSSRALTAITNSPGIPPGIDYWVLGSVAVLALASFGLINSGFSAATEATRWRVTSEVLLGAGIVQLFVIETVIVRSSDNTIAIASDIRIYSLVLLAAALLVLSRRATPFPLTPKLSYIALALAFLATLSAQEALVLHPYEWWFAVSILAIGLFARSLWSKARDVHDRERRVLWWLGFAIVAPAATTLWIASANATPSSFPELLLPLPVISLIVSAVLLAVLGLTMLARGATTHVVERIAAALVLAPSTAWALDSVSRILGLNNTAIELAPATAAVVIGTLSMTLRVREQHAHLRRASELSALAVAGVTTVSAILQPQLSHWLIALLVAIVLLLSSISSDGIFGSASPRRHILWAAVAFATWALWIRLGESQVDALEAYVLPLAALILAIAALTARAELREHRLTSTPYIAFVGLLIGIVPLSIDVAAESGSRAIAITGFSGALLLLAAFVRPRPQLLALWGAAIAASATGLIVATTARTLYAIYSERGASLETDGWILGAVALLALASVGLVVSRFAATAADTRWKVTSEALLGTALVVLYALETAIALHTGSGSTANDIRVIALVALGAVLLVVSVSASTPPLTRRVSYLAFGQAAAHGAIALVASLITPIEWVTVLLGAALIAHGALRLARDPDARSWQWLAPGIVITLVPSLVLTFTDVASVHTLWRIVALGIVGVLLIIVGAWRKLAAPLLIASAVVLIHAAHTFAPAIVSFYQLTDWWMWAVVGGAIVLFLGITLERRIRDFKSLNTKISSLR
ncbi:SCO7613 C-terminal domain-containing membrane protein [Salinibacterium sp. M195]|uniref:SCO7613 C-terminal domain-containing membrane protein n=1 Tax=Salinibacterium sp. M195 TaxID=2583374 RepID=UPI001C6352CF|nr:hypothetical protein [Salinibacterium sp. M195]QYH35855.1 hypothetical protein FFT87_07760 [Salinibacterium sp. M195]